MAVYVLVDEQRACCKIGFSTDESTLQKRIKSLQTASPYPLKVEAMNLTLTRNHERGFHLALSPFLIGGGREWFDYSQAEVVEVVRLIKSMEFIPESVDESEVLNSEISYTQGFDSCGCDDDSVECCEVLGMCCHCLCRHFGFEPETYRELGERCNEISNCTFNPIYSRLGLYVCSDARAVPASELMEYLLDGNGEYGSMTWMSCCLLVNALVDDFDDFAGSFLTPGGVLIVLRGEFADVMERAEDLYSSWFSDVDSFGSQLFVACVNKQREVKEILYGFGWHTERQ